MERTNHWTYTIRKQVKMAAEKTTEKWRKKNLLFTRSQQSRTEFRAWQWSDYDVGSSHRSRIPWRSTSNSFAIASSVLFYGARPYSVLVFLFLSLTPHFFPYSTSKSVEWSINFTRFISQGGLCQSQIVFWADFLMSLRLCSWLSTCLFNVVDLEVM